MTYEISFGANMAARYGTDTAEFLALANPVRAFFQARNQLFTSEEESNDLRLARENMFQMARWWKFEDYKLEALTHTFGHNEVSRMAYGSRISCDKFHLGKGSHWALHVEPSRWLRLTYLLDCQQHRVMLSSTLDNIEMITKNHKWNYKQANKGLSVERVVKDCLDLADIAYKGAVLPLDEIDRTEEHFGLGLNLLVGMKPEFYTSRGREFCEQSRNDTFRDDFEFRGW